MGFVLNFLSGLFKVLVIALFAYHKGKEAQKIKQQEKVLENVKKANDAIARAKRDPALRERLRKKYGLK